MRGKKTMWELVPVKEKRKFQIIRSLFHAEESLTINQLAKKSDSSVRGVHNYLKEWENQLKEIGGKLISSASGIQLNMPHNIGMDHFEREVYRQSHSFIFLETILFDETLMNDEIQEKLFISSSTLNRMVRRIQQGMEDFGIQLKTTPFRVIGDERLVRRFYRIYFTEAYSIFDWPFKSIDLNVLKLFLPTPKEYRKATSELKDYYTFRFEFAIGAIRSLNGHFLPTWTHQDQALQYKQMKQVIAELKPLFEEIDVPSKRKSLFLNQLAYWKVRYSRKYILERIDLSPAYNKKLEKIKELIQTLDELYQFPKLDHTNRIIQLDYTLDFYANYPHKKRLKNYILFKPTGSTFVPYLRQTTPLLITLAIKGLQRICLDRNIDYTEEMIQQLLFFLITQWEDLMSNLFQNFGSCKLLLFSHSHLRYAKIIAQAIEASFNEAIEIETYEDVLIDEERLSWYDFDILLTTICLTCRFLQRKIFLKMERTI